MAVSKTEATQTIISRLSSDPPFTPTADKTLNTVSSPQTAEFYDIEPILHQNATYNIIIGERSNGKTYSALCKLLESYWKTGRQGAYIRRYDVEVKGKEGSTLFDGHVANGYISQLTDGKYDRVRYYSGRFHLAYFDTDLNKIIYQEEPFCFCFALNNMEHYKGNSYPNVYTIIFDEFITRQYYLPNEFVLFMNMLSTIIRRRLGVKIFMLANTVNKFCPYFKEMGIRHIESMSQGNIDLYTYGTSKLRVAVEYCATPAKKSKESDLYFAFDNPSLQMITGGAWEVDMYPHCPVPFTSSDIQFIFFINFDTHLLQCECVCTPYETTYASFIFIHEKTTPLKHPDTDIVFTDRYDPRPNYFRNIRKPATPAARRIAEYFRLERVYYQDNEVGEIVRNYLKFCTVSSRSVNGAS